ncbi:hypothetical protein WG66_016011, partial [Moniliophthora roreri]
FFPGILSLTITSKTSLFHQTSLLDILAFLLTLILLHARCHS